MIKVFMFLLMLCALAVARHIDVTPANWLTSLGAAVAGDTLHLGAGTFNGNVSPNHSGTEGAPIVILGTDTHSTVIASTYAGMVMTQSWFVFERLHFRSNGASDAYHVFHIIHPCAGHITFRNCHFSNVTEIAIKINFASYDGPALAWPDYILVENCTMELGHAGLMNNDGSDFLTCRGNYTYGLNDSGFHYTYFSKGGLAYTLFENNLAVGGRLGTFSFGDGTMWVPNYAYFRHDLDLNGAATVDPGDGQPFGNKVVETYRSICRNNVIIGANYATGLQAVIDCDIHNNTFIGCNNSLVKEMGNGKAVNVNFYNNLVLNGGDDLFIQFDGYSEPGVVSSRNNIAIGSLGSPVDPATIFTAYSATNPLSCEWRIRSAAASLVGTGETILSHPSWPAFYAVPGGNYDYYGNPRPALPCIGATEVDDGSALQGTPVLSSDGSVRLTVLPNPSSHGALFSLNFSTGRPLVDAGVYDITGRLVRSLHYGARVQGGHRLVWDGLSHSGTRAAPGHYIMRISLGKEVFYKKFQVVR